MFCLRQRWSFIAYIFYSKNNICPEKRVKQKYFFLEKVRSCRQLLGNFFSQFTQKKYQGNASYKTRVLGTFLEHDD